MDSDCALSVLCQWDFSEINTSKAERQILTWVRTKLVGHNTTEISRLGTTDLHLHGQEQKLDVYLKECATASYSKLLVHHFASYLW